MDKNNANPIIKSNILLILTSSLKQSFIYLIASLLSIGFLVENNIRQGNLEKACDTIQM